MNARMGALVLAVVIGSTGCGTILRSLGPKGGGGGGGGGGDSREERVRAKAEREKQRFLTLQAPDSAAAHMNWIKQYEKSRGYCHTWAWKDHGMKDKIEACAKAVNAHYLDLAPVAVQMLIDKGKALQAHWAVRKLGDHSRHRFWNLDSQAPVKLAQTAAKARAEWAQKLYEGSKKYVEPNNMGCVASASPLPKDNGRIAEPVYHVKIGQKLYVRCYFPSTVASVLSGKEGAVRLVELLNQVGKLDRRVRVIDHRRGVVPQSDLAAGLLTPRSDTRVIQRALARFRHSGHPIGMGDAQLNLQVVWEVEVRADHAVPIGQIEDLLVRPAALDLFGQPLQGDTHHLGSAVPDAPLQKFPAFFTDMGRFHPIVGIRDMDAIGSDERRPALIVVPVVLTPLEHVIDERLRTQRTFLTHGEGVHLDLVRPTHAMAQLQERRMELLHPFRHRHWRVPLVKPP